MIRKPQEKERRSAAHEAAGRAIDAASTVRELSQSASKLASNGCAIYLAGMMAFGLLISSTPWWFKAIVLGLGFVIFQARRRSSRL